MSEEEYITRYVPSESAGETVVVDTESDGHELLVVDPKKSLTPASRLTLATVIAIAMNDAKFKPELAP